MSYIIIPYPNVKSGRVSILVILLLMIWLYLYPSNDLIGMPMLCKAWDIPIVRQTYDITKFEPKVMCKVTHVHEILSPGCRTMLCCPTDGQLFWRFQTENFWQTQVLFNVQKVFVLATDTLKSVNLSLELILNILIPGKVVYPLLAWYEFIWYWTLSIQFSGG